MTNTINDAEILEYLIAFPDDTFSEVARALNIKRDKVSAVAHKNDIYRKLRRAEFLRLRDEIREYIETHPEESRDNVGRKFGISASRVSYLARKRRVRRTGVDQEFEGRVVKYVNSHKKESYVVIGKHFACSKGRISAIARAHNIFRHAPWGQVGKKHRKDLAYIRKHQRDMQVVEIAKNLGVSTGYVSTIAAKDGLRRQAPKGSGLSIVGRVVRRNVARSVPLAPAASAPALVRRLPADHELEGEIQQLEQTLQQLRARKALLEIRFEEDGDTIIVYGVGEPIARHRSDWLRWLKAGGAALLRERCNKLERAS
jgi:predicted XRE-type DNA-binding protein